jgi:hypothetical protein
MRFLHRVPSEAMMSLMSGALGGGLGASDMTAPEPSRTRKQVWSYWTRGDTEALSGGGLGASDMR